MRIGNRLFPYPTLNNNQELSKYKNSNFSFTFETDSNGKVLIEEDSLVLKNIKFTLEDSYLKTLYDAEIIDCSLIVESSVASFREIFSLKETPQNITVDKKKVADEVVLSAYLWAKEEIHSFSSEHFNDVYNGISFEIEKYDILAIDDGFTFRVDIDSNDNKVSSIFSIVKTYNNCKEMEVTNERDKIVISLSEDYFTKYNSIKLQAGTNNIMFGMLAIPSLISVLSEIKANVDFESIDEIIEQNRWFKSICMSYERETGQELDLELFKETKPITIAQKVINYALVNGLNDYAEFMLHGNTENEDEIDE